MLLLSVSPMHKSLNFIVCFHMVKCLANVQIYIGMMLDAGESLQLCRYLKPLGFQVSTKYHTDSTVFAGLEPIVNYINSSYKGMH